jgi:hypothetical protein
MTSYQNPFRERASEQQRDLVAFLRNFGAGALDLLPEALWDRLLVIRSAPGGGKTSLMRLFTIDSLRLINERHDDLLPLATRLEQLGALGPSGPTRLGIRLGLDRDYRALADAEISADVARRLFFRLLDARIAVAVIRAALTAVNRVFPVDANLVTIDAPDPSHDLAEAAARLGGWQGRDILEAARKAEGEYLATLDSLLPVDWESLARGHLDLYSLKLLSRGRILVDGVPLGLQPLVMLDDGHQLAPAQRDALLAALLDRNLEIARWYSERFEALSAQELLAGDIEGRDYELLQIESAARESGSAGRSRFRFDRFLTDVGNRRAAPTLMRYGEGHIPFTELLEADGGDPAPVPASLVDTLRDRVQSVAADRHRYESWMQEASVLQGYEAAIRWRELEILIERDQQRVTIELFDFALDEADADRLSGSSIREAAALMLAEEHSVPFYFGPETLAKLSSQNIEQYLSLSGELFEEMLSAMTLNRRPRIAPVRQDTVFHEASERMWRSIPRRVPHGRDVQRLLLSISTIARRDTYRPTAPYAPGVTGTALTMTDRDLLLDRRRRLSVPGADRLFDALGSALAYNMLSAELDRPVKGDRFMVLYLNRLLCVRFGLPLGRGGFRERRLDVMSNWMLEPEVEPESSKDALALGLDR